VNTFDHKLILSPDHGAWGAFHAAEKAPKSQANTLFTNTIEIALLVKRRFEDKGRAQNEQKKNENNGAIFNLPEGDPRNNPVGFDWNNPDFTFSHVAVSPGFKAIWSTPELNMLHTANAIVALAHLELGEKQMARAYALAGINETSQGLSIAGDRTKHWSLAEGIAQKRTRRDSLLHDLLMSH
jgi:hypothetical protein